MGNTTQCGFLSSIDHHFQYLGEENHFLYGQIKHFKNEKVQNQHFAIKKIKFPTENKLKQFRDFIHLYQQYCCALRLINANQYIDPSIKKKSHESQGQPTNIEKQNSNPIFNCNKNNFLFTSATEQLSCYEQSFSLTLNLKYLQQKSGLKSILCEKAINLQKATQNSKINQNILLQLENKVKLCEYDKIDKLPHKERTMVNMFFTQIQVLRMLDYMLTALYGLRLNGIEDDSVRLDLFFRPSQRDELSYFCPRVIDYRQMGNFQRSFETLKKWLNQQNAKFHHNWSVKQKQLVSYIHPDNLQKLTQMLLSQEQDNFVFKGSLPRQDVQKQNIFALGLIILQICLLEPQICSKIYHISVCKQQQKLTPNTKKQMKYSFHRQNLTIKLNHSAIQKYLIQMKTKYSEKFVDLVETMIFGPSLSSTSKINSSTKAQILTYQDVIESLQVLIQHNVQNLKSVYNSTNKSKSKSKHCTQKNSRNSSLSRQVSVSGVSNQSLSSSSSLSMLPVQSQQKILSIELLKKHCKKLQNRLQKVLIKSQLQTLKGSFVKRQEKLEELILKDQQRILSQLNKLSYQKPLPQKQTRFGYRRAQQNQQSNTQTYDERFPTTIDLTIPNDEYGNFRLNMPSSLSVKNQPQSQDKQKRINSTAKTKKILLQKARDEQNLGSSVCQTIYLNKSKDMTHIDESQMSFINNGSINRSLNVNFSKNELKNTQITDKEISAFEQDSLQQFSSKSELKNLIALKNKNSTIIKEPFNVHLNTEQKSPKELKSKQLYEIYMKEYKNLINSQKTINS